MAKSKTEKLVGRMVEKIQNNRNPMTTLGKVCYWGLILGLLFSVILLPGILKSLMGTSLLFLVPMVIFSILILVFVFKRKNKLASLFWQDKECGSKINYVKVSDAGNIEEFCDGKTWVFGSKKEELVPFIYNWFLTAGVLKKSSGLDVYYLPVSVLKKRFKDRNDVKVKLNDDQEIFLIKLAELDMDDDKEQKLGNEALVLRPFDFYNWLTKNFIVTGLEINNLDDSDEDDEEDEYEDDDELEEDELDDEEEEDIEG